MPDGMPTTEKRIDRIEKTLEWAIGWDIDNPIASAKAFGLQHSRLVNMAEKLDKIERAIWSLGWKVVCAAIVLFGIGMTAIVLLSKMVAEYQTGVKVGASILGGGS